MWRRVSAQLHAFTPWRSSTQIHHPVAARNALRSVSIPAILRAPRYYSLHFGSEPPVIKKSDESILPTTTGRERKLRDGDMLEVRVKDNNSFKADASVGPFGTMESPAVIKSHYDKRFVGCSGGGDHKHEIVWFWLEKCNLFECPMCSQYFVLEVYGRGGSPEGRSCNGKWKHPVVYRR